MKIVLQWKCNRWVNCQDANGKTIFFDSVDDAKKYLGNAYKVNEHRIAEYLGGRKYREIEVL